MPRVVTARDDDAYEVDAGVTMYRTVVAVAGRPSLWSTAIRQWRRTTPAGWWRRRPFLPVPPREYLRFRMITQYGDTDHAWVPDDVVKYLRWCRAWESGGQPR